MTKAQMLANRLNGAMDVGNMTDDFIRREARRAGAYQAPDAVTIYDDWTLPDGTILHWNAESGVRRWIGRFA